MGAYWAVTYSKVFFAVAPGMGSYLFEKGSELWARVLKVGCTGVRIGL